MVKLKPPSEFSEEFCRPGRASFLIGGQWGSEGKGAAAAWLMERGQCRFDCFTTNAGAQAGHTSIVKGEKIVLFHLPTAAVTKYKLTGSLSPVWLNAGSVIDREVLDQEVQQHYSWDAVTIHPYASIIVPDCVEASRASGSNSEKIAGVGKGVGEAIARRVRRVGVVARDYYRREYVSSLNVAGDWLDAGKSVLVEVPQGASLSLAHSGFYPYVTSRDCTVMQAMNDAAIHPHYYGQTMAVFRTYPIRVGNHKGYSGDCYPDQEETSWEAIGVAPEITTVSKRVRRVFTFSRKQFDATVALTRPDWIFLSFCNYLPHGTVRSFTEAGCNFTEVGRSFTEAVRDFTGEVLKDYPERVFHQWGPTSSDVGALRWPK